METLRLRRIQQPSNVEELLDAFVTHAKVLPKDCYPIRDVSALPAALQRVIARESEKGRACLCWGNPLDTWLFTCEMSLASSRERAAPVLQVNRYDEAGELKLSGNWMIDGQGKWHVCGA